MKRDVLYRTAVSYGCQAASILALSRSKPALPLQELQLVDEALHGSVAPLFGEPRSDRVKILLQTGCEVPHRGGLRRLGLAIPSMSHQV